MAREHYHPFQELDVGKVLSLAKRTHFPSHNRQVLGGDGRLRLVQCSGTNKVPATVETYQKDEMEGNVNTRFTGSCCNSECVAKFNFWPTGSVWRWHQI